MSVCVLGESVVVFGLKMGWVGGGGGCCLVPEKGRGKHEGDFTLIKEVVGMENMATLLAWKCV